MAYFICYYVLPFFFFFCDLSAMEQDLDLFALVRQGDLESLSSIFTKVVNVSQHRDQEGNTLLHVAPTAEIAQFLLHHKVDVHAGNLQKSTPLHASVWEGRPDDFSVTEVLLDHGGDITALNANKQTPVHNAVSKSPEFLHRLLTHVPRYAIETFHKPQRIQIVRVLLCCFQFGKNPVLSQVPKDMQLMLARYCMMPPYKFINEQEMVNALLFGKLDAVKDALTTNDHRGNDPAFLELHYWPHDRSKLLDPLRVFQFVPGIIASIGRLVDFEFSYTFKENALCATQTPSAE